MSLRNGAKTSGAMCGDNCAFIVGTMWIMLLACMTEDATLTSEGMRDTCATGNFRPFEVTYQNTGSILHENVCQERISRYDECYCYHVGSYSWHEWRAEEVPLPELLSEAIPAWAARPWHETTWCVLWELPATTRKMKTRRRHRATNFEDIWGSNLAHNPMDAGHCFFACMSQALWSTEKPLAMRRLTTRLWRQEHCRELLEEVAASENMTSRQYLRSIASVMWGGRPECCILAFHFPMIIRVWSPQGQMIFTEFTPGEIDHDMKITKVDLGLYMDHYVLLHGKPHLGSCEETKTDTTRGGMMTAPKRAAVRGAKPKSAPRGSDPRSPLPRRKKKVERSPLPRTKKTQMPAAQAMVEQDRAEEQRSVRNESRSRIDALLAKRRAEYDPALVLKTTKVQGAVMPAADVPPVWHPKPTVARDAQTASSSTQRGDETQQPTVAQAQATGSSSSTARPTLAELAAQANALPKAMPKKSAENQAAKKTVFPEKDVAKLQEKSDSWIVPKFWQTGGSSGQDLYCLLCQKWATAQHTQTERHKTKVAYNGYRPYSDEEEEKQITQAVLDSGGFLTPESPHSSRHSDALERELELRKLASRQSDARGQYEGGSMHSIRTTLGFVGGEEHELPLGRLLLSGLSSIC